MLRYERGGRTPLLALSAHEADAVEDRCLIESANQPLRKYSLTVVSLRGGHHAGEAQLVERHLGKVEGVGSTPTVGSGGYIVADRLKLALSEEARDSPGRRGSRKASYHEY